MNQPPWKLRILRSGPYVLNARVPNGNAETPVTPAKRETSKRLVEGESTGARPRRAYSANFPNT